MFVNFVSDLLKSALVDLCFKRPVQIQFSRDTNGRFDLRANINPSSGSTQTQPHQMLVMQAPPMYGYPGYPAGMPMQQPVFPGHMYTQPLMPPATPPTASSAPSQPTTGVDRQPEVQVPEFLRR